MAIINANGKQELNELLQQDGKVLVDFFATWCNPCRMLGQVLHDLADENPNYKIVKIDVDKNMELAREYGVSSIPRMFVFENGKVVDDIVGYVDASRLKAALK